MHVQNVQRNAVNQHACAKMCLRKLLVYSSLA